MSRVACSLLLIAVCSASVRAADLPPGALARLGDDRFRAGSVVYHLALSPDGKQFATARGTGHGLLTLTVWDAITGRPVREREVNTELFKGFVWGEGGALAVVVRAEPGAKGQLAKLVPDDFRVWDFADPKAAPPPVLPVTFATVGCGSDGGGRVIAARPKDSPEYTDFIFSADGKRVAARWKSADGKHAVHVFDLKPTATASKLNRAGTIDLGAEGADAVHISADGKTLVTFRRLASAAPDEHTDQYAAAAWDVATGKPAQPVQVRTYPAAQLMMAPRLMLTPDGRGLVLFSEDEGWGFDLFDLGTRKRRTLTRWKYTPAQIDEGRPRDRGGFMFSADGSVLAVAVDGNTFVIDVVTGKELGRLEGHADTPTAVAVSADGARIATADRYGLVRLWDAKTLRPVEEATGHRAPVSYAELSPDGKRLLTWAEDETVRLWDVATGKELRAFAGALGVSGERPFIEAPATFTPDGTAILYNVTKRLVTRDLLTGSEVPLPGDMKNLGPQLVVFAPDGRSVLTCDLNTNRHFTLAVWDWPTGKKRFAVEDLLGADAPGFSPDGTAVFTYCRSPQRWDAKTGKELPPAWKDEVGGINPLVSLRPNPRHLLRDNDEKGPRVVEAGSGKPVPRFRLKHQSVEPFDTHLNAYWGVALSPVGGQFAWSWGLDEPDTIQLSESASCMVRRELRGHRGLVRVLGFTPDGTKLLTAGGDHTVLVWDMRLQSVPLPDAIKKETNAAKLWDTLATGKADAAYLAMARLAREPEAALKMAKMRLKPVAKSDGETDAGKLADARAVELLEALGTDESRALLKELAGGHADAFRTQEAKRAIERHK